MRITCGRARCYLWLSKESAPLGGALPRNRRRRLLVAALLSGLRLPWRGRPLYRYDCAQSTNSIRNSERLAARLSVTQARGSSPEARNRHCRERS